MSNRNYKTLNCEPESPGAILRGAREAAGLSIDNVAGRLYLLRSVVDNLESDTYERIRGDTFVRGYMRNYARLLGIPSEKVLRPYDSMRQSKLNAKRRSAATPVRGARGVGRIGSLALMLGIGALPLVGKRDGVTPSPFAGASELSSLQADDVMQDSSKLD